MMAFRNNRIAFRIAIFTAAFAGSLSLWGQFTSASLSGVVMDSTNSVVPGAKVTVQNIQTSLSRVTSTGTDGAYLFSALPIGSYRLTVEKQGFSTYVQNGITLDVSQAVKQTVILQTGAVSQKVNVSADAEMLPTQTSTVSQVVGERQIMELPLNGRETQALVFLAPGAIDTTNNYCGFNCQGGVYQGAQFAQVNGGGPGNVNYQMDGGDHNDNYLNTNFPFPNPDAVQEFSVQSDNMSAEYGNASVVVNVITKSGTNQFHGDVFEFIRNGDLNARNFFAPTQDTLKRNQFGGNVGGPILKDKLFFFFTYQGTRTTSAPGEDIAFVPSAAERSGNFAGSGITVTDPATGSPFPGNQIPSSRFSAPSLYFLQHIPLPNGPNGQVTFLGPTARQNDDQFMPKIDYISGKNRLSGRYFYANYNQPPDLAAGQANLLAIDGSGIGAQVHTVALNDTYTVSPSLLFSTWFSYDRSLGKSYSGAPFGFPDAGVQIAAPSGPKAMEAADANGYFYVQSGHPGEFDRNDWRIREVASWHFGAHELHFGGDLYHLGTPEANTYLQTGEFVFGNALSGSNLSDFLLGTGANFTQDGGIYYNYGGTEGDLFAQDNWRVSKSLTVNFGLRWEPYLTYTDQKNRMPCYRPGMQSQRYPNAPTGLIYAGDAGCPAGGTNNALNNFAPRFGFAYPIGQNTVIRGGGGIYYTLPNTDQINNFTTVAPFSPLISLTDVSFQNPYGSAGVTNPFPSSFASGALPPSNTAFVLPVGVGGTFGPQYKLPSVATWNVSVQRQVGANWLFSVGYFANAGYNLSSNAVGREQVDPALYIPGNSTEANTQARRIDPNFSGVQFYPTDYVSRYEALQVNVEKRFSRGLSLLANYTFSKKEDDYGPDGTVTDPFYRALDWGISKDNVPNVFRLSAVWQTPHLTASALAGALVNGWELTGITTWQDGFPFTVFSGVDNSLSGIGADRAEFTGSNIGQAVLGGQSTAQEIKQYFNTSLFTSNPIGTFGNSPKNALRGPDLFNQDFAAIKNFNPIEALKLQFRAEFFNVFNNVNFSKPGSTVNSGSFGQITSAASPRILQFALKVMF